MDSNAALSPLAIIHVLICLTAITSGAVVVYGMLIKNAFRTLTALFLFTTVASCATGYLFPSDHVTPAKIIGVIGLVSSVAAIVARYSFHEFGGWRQIYVVSAIFALYLNVFVLIAQLFAKVAFLQVIAPTQASPAFIGAQTVLLIVFTAVGIGAIKRYQPPPSYLAPL